MPRLRPSGYEKIECIYQKLPGWKTPTEGSTEFEKLAAEGSGIPGVRRKRSRSQGRHDFPTGPDRDHTILVDEFVAELKTAAKKA